MCVVVFHYFCLFDFITFLCKTLRLSNIDAVAVAIIKRLTAAVEGI